MYDNLIGHRDKNIHKKNIYIKADTSTSTVKSTATLRPTDFFFIAFVAQRHLWINERKTRQGNRNSETLYFQMDFNIFSIFFSSFF